MHTGMCIETLSWYQSNYLLISMHTIMCNGIENLIPG
jgi:hypothetical protein